MSTFHKFMTEYGELAVSIALSLCIAVTGLAVVLLMIAVAFPQWPSPPSKSRPPSQYTD